MSVTNQEISGSIPSGFKNSIVPNFTQPVKLESRKNARIIISGFNVVLATLLSLYAL